tara:strand:+ start:6313 stop:7059 length:747 start_codon:yes stop_codon:yes gene_type:complete
MKLTAEELRKIVEEEIKLFKENVFPKVDVEPPTDRSDSYLNVPDLPIDSPSPKKVKKKIKQKRKERYTAADDVEFKGNFGKFDKNKKYPDGSWGQFVQASYVLTALEVSKINKNEETIEKTAAAIIGAGSDKVAPWVGTLIALGGAIVSSPILTVAGIGAGVYSIAKSLKKQPSLAEQNPQLNVFKIDKQYSSILENELEDSLLRAYQKVFVRKVRTAPETQMLNINKFIEYMLRTYKGGRTLKGYKK